MAMFPASATAEGRQFNGAPFPATASAEGAQFNVPPSLATLLEMTAILVTDVCKRSAISYQRCAP